MTLRAVTEILIFAYGVAFLHVSAVTLVAPKKGPVQVVYALLAADFGLLCLAGSLGVHFHDQNLILNFVSFFALAALGPLGAWFTSLYLGDENSLRMFAVTLIALVGIGVGSAVRVAGVSWHLSFSWIYLSLALNLTITGLCLLRKLGLPWHLPKLLKGFFAIYGSVILLVILMLVGFLTNHSAFVDVLWLLCLLAMFGLTLLVSRNPELFRGLQVLAEETRSAESNRLNNLDIEQLAQRLQLLMEKERLYSKPNLLLEDVAQILKLKPHQLSELVNRFFKTSFTQFIHEFRVREAQRLLQDPSLRILDISLQCGFSSKSSFNRVFHQKLGTSPTEWRNQKASQAGKAFTS